MEPIVSFSKHCPACGVEVTETAYFCSNCGKSIRVKPGATDVWHQILIYLVSFFLAPFGLSYALKYLRQPDRKSKIIGLVSLILTIVAIVTVIWLSVWFEKVYMNAQYGGLLDTSGIYY